MLGSLSDAVTLSIYYVVKLINRSSILQDFLKAKNGYVFSQ